MRERVPDLGDVGGGVGILLGEGFGVGGGELGKGDRGGAFLRLLLGRLGRCDCGGEGEEEGKEGGDVHCYGIRGERTGRDSGVERVSDGGGCCRALCRPEGMR